MADLIDAREFEQAQSLRRQAADLLAMAYRLDGLRPKVVAHEHRHGTGVSLIWARGHIDSQQAADLMGSTFDAKDGEHISVEDIESPFALVGADGGGANWEARDRAPGQQEPLVVSLDDGLTFVPARSGVRVHYQRAQVPGEDERGELQFRLTQEGVITDLWVTRDEHLDHNIGTSSSTIDEVISNLIESGA